MDNNIRKPVVCNKCGLEAHKNDTQESTLLLNSMHVFGAEFDYCGMDDGLDMMGTTFVLCQDCLLSFLRSFKHKVEYVESNSWVMNDER